MTKIKLIKTQNNNSSKQIKDELFNDNDIIKPDFDFDVLLEVYNNSSIISGVIGKIATKSDIKFKKTKSDNLNNVLAKLDIEEIVLDLLIFGNAYFERLTNLAGEKTLNFKHIVVPTFRVANSKSGFDYFQKSKKNIKKVGFKKNEILCFKRTSIGNIHYGESIFSSSLDEIILLNYITKYFKKHFASGNISPMVLYDESQSLTDEQLEKIENLIKDRINGLDNADTTVFIGTKIGKIDLATIFDPEKYIALKRELKEDIAIDLNIPFDLLSSQNSNRATSQTSLEVLYSDIIKPLQNRILRQFKEQLLEWFENEKGGSCFSGIEKSDIENIEFEEIKLKNEKDEMETLTGYLKNGVLNVNEVRRIVGLGDEIEGGDEYKVINDKNELNFTKKDDEYDIIKQEIKKIYSK